MFVFHHLVTASQKLAYRIAVIWFILTVQLVHAADLVSIDPLSIKAESWLIMDGDSGQILAQHNANEQRAPASLTKMMVAYITLKEIKAGNLRFNDVLTVPNEVNSIAGDESRMRLKAGEQLTVSELLTGLLVTSANDAAVTLATHIAGNIPAFVNIMNFDVEQLGLTGTHFANVSGITQDGHYTTALDMAKLSKVIIEKYPEYTQFSKIQHFSHGTFSEDATNHLLKADPSVDGMKTGYTKAAGFNLVATAHRPQAGLNQDRRIFAVVMGSTTKYSRTNDAGLLLNSAYEQTQNVQLLTRNQPLATFKIWQAAQDEVNLLAPYNVFVTVSNPNYIPPVTNPALSPQKTTMPLAIQPVAITQPVVVQQATAAQPHHIHYQLTLTEQPIIAPLSQQQTVGQLAINYNGTPITSLPLHMAQDIQPAGFFKRNWDKLKICFYQLFNIKLQPIQLI